MIFNINIHYTLKDKGYYEKRIPKNETLLPPTFWAAQHELRALRLAAHHAFPQLNDQ